jgi:hypothetical protein
MLVDVAYELFEKLFTSHGATIGCLLKDIYELLRECKLLVFMVLRELSWALCCNYAFRISIRVPISISLLKYATRSWQNASLFQFFNLATTTNALTGVGGKLEVTHTLVTWLDCNLTSMQVLVLLSGNLISIFVLDKVHPMIVFKVSQCNHELRLMLTSIGITYLVGCDQYLTWTIYSFIIIKSETGNSSSSSFGCSTKCPSQALHNIVKPSLVAMVTIAGTPSSTLIDAQVVFGEMQPREHSTLMTTTIELRFVLWHCFILDWVVTLQRPPWPPPVQLATGIQLRPVPWPSLNCYAGLVWLFKSLDQMAGDIPPKAPWLASDLDNWFRVDYSSSTTIASLQYASSQLSTSLYEVIQQIVSVLLLAQRRATILLQGHLAVDLRLSKSPSYGYTWVRIKGLQFYGQARGMFTMFAMVLCTLEEAYSPFIGNTISGLGASHISSGGECQHTAMWVLDRLAMGHLQQQKRELYREAGIEESF